jgi:hypothetical protein
MLPPVPELGGAAVTGLCWQAARRLPAPPGIVNLSSDLPACLPLCRRTSAKRLGYVNELWVDPASLAVASLYLRASPSNILAPSCCEQAREHQAAPVPAWHCCRARVLLGRRLDGATRDEQARAMPPPLCAPCQSPACRAHLRMVTPPLLPLAPPFPQATSCWPPCARSATWCWCTTSAR